MEKFVIEGGVPLSGTIAPAGNKNGALPILAACLLTDDEVILRNVPRIRDVEAMTLLLEQLGARVQWLGPGEISIDASTVDSCEVDRELAERIRASFLLAGPLLARFGRAHMPPPGGDVIGRRRLDPHLDAFRALGATVDDDRGEIRVEAALGLRPCDFLMDEPSVMATENALMAAALTRGPTVIRNAASEPHVQDLARMLVAMGAEIDGIGSNVMTVHGAGSLRGLHAHDRARPHRDRLVHGARRRHRRRADRQGHGPRGPADDPPRVRPSGPAQRGARRRCDRARQPEARDPQRQRRPHAQGRGRPVARVPGRPDQHRARAGHPGRGLGDDPREDVREPPVLHRQAGDDGRRDHDLRSAPRDRRRTPPSARRSEWSRPTSAPAWRC